MSGSTGSVSDFGFLDRETIAALRNGEHSAYDKVYLNCFNKIEDFLYFMLRDRDKAEELCQDIFIRLWEHREKINPDLNFKSFLYTMAKTTALNELKHQKVVDKYINNQKYSLDPGYSDTPDAILMRDELSLLVEIYLSQMPEQRRKVFEMSRREGLTNEEIALRLNISESTVRVHLHKAIAELRKLIAILLFFV